MGRSVGSTILKNDVIIHINTTVSDMVDEIQNAGIQNVVAS